MTRPLPLIVAHRGASADAPENTLAAFRLAWLQDADAIEGDFHLTADGELVCVHDDDFGATAGVMRSVASMSLAEVRTLRVGFRHRPDTWIERVPTIGEVFSVVPRGKQIFIELKGVADAVPALMRAMGASSLAADQICVISFDAQTVAAVKRTAPTVKAYWLVEFEDDKRPEWLSVEQILAELSRTGADGLDVEAKDEIVNRALTHAIRAASYELHTWTIDDVSRAKHFVDLGVQSVTTNRPGVIRAGLP